MDIAEVAKRSGLPASTLRYYEDMEIDGVAERIRSTAGAVYRALSRIRMSLLTCVEKELKLEGAGA